MRGIRWVARLFPFACVAVLAPTALSMTAVTSQETRMATPVVDVASANTLTGLAPNQGSTFAGHTLTFASGLSEARYRVHEATLGTNDLHEVLGRASGVAGSVSVDAAGAVLVDRSHIAIDLRTLQTDQAARDEIVRTATLDTSTYPVSDFYTTGLDHLGIWPTSGEAHFGVQGDLVLHGVRRPIRLDVVGQFTPDGVTGTASGTLSLSEFGINAPQLGPLVAVQDKVGIELDFRAELNLTSLIANDPSEPTDIRRSLDQETSDA